MSRGYIADKARVRATEKGKEWKGARAPTVSIAAARSLDDMCEGLESSEPFQGLEVLERPRHPGVVVADAETTEEIKEGEILSLTDKGDRSLKEGRVPPGVERGTYDLVRVDDNWHLQSAELDMLVCRPDLKEGCWDLGHQFAVEIVTSPVGVAVSPRLFELNANRLEMPTVFLAKDGEMVTELLGGLKDRGDPASGVWEFESPESFVVGTEMGHIMMPSRPERGPIGDPFSASRSHGISPRYPPAQHAVLVRVRFGGASTVEEIERSLPLLDGEAVKNAVIALEEDGSIAVEGPPDYIR